MKSLSSFPFTFHQSNFKVRKLFTYVWISAKYKDGENAAVNTHWRNVMGLRNLILFFISFLNSALSSEYWKEQSWIFKFRCHPHSTLNSALVLSVVRFRNAEVSVSNSLTNCLSKCTSILAHRYGHQCSELNLLKLECDFRATGVIVNKFLYKKFHVCTCYELCNGSFWTCWSYAFWRWSADRNM
jgi:hypothetical protein